MKPLMMIVVAVVIAGAAFYGGMQYQKTQVSARGAGFGGAGFAGRRGAGGAGAGRVIGDILNIDSNSITVKLPDGSTKIVLTSDSTTYEQTSSSQRSNLAVGTHVGIFGMTNTDGSVTARDVQVNPMMRPPNGGPGGASGMTGTPAAQ